MSVHRNIKTQGITSAACAIQISIYFEMNRQPDALTSSRRFLEVVSAILWISVFPISTDNILQFQFPQKQQEHFPDYANYLDFLDYPSKDLSK